MPQLTRITTRSGLSLNLRCPYQANVMKTFESKSKKTGVIADEVKLTAALRADESRLT
jgi:hypothetical protein